MTTLRFFSFIILSFCSVQHFSLLSASPLPSPVPPFAGAIPDGTGGQFVLYHHCDVVRLQHIDAQGRIWPGSKTLIEGSTPVVLQCKDVQGRIWILSYNAEQEEEQKKALIQCFDIQGKRLFENDGLELEIQGDPEIRFDSNNRLVISTAHRSIWIDETGDLSFAPSNRVNTAVFQETAVHESAPALIPFQTARDNHFLEISTYIAPDEIREVEIYMENSDHAKMYHFSGFMSGDFHSWLIHLDQMPKGRYYLNMRIGEREQVEEIILM